MILDYAENIIQLLAILIALLLCLFRFISSKTRGWIYATAFLLCNLMSSYYWTAYLVIMGDEPNVSDVFTYAGWNIGFAVLLLLVLHMKSREERRYFHPLMLLPIPLNVWQLTLYLPFGGALNSIYQVAVLTAAACLSLQSVCWYRKNRRSGGQKPYVAAVVLLYAVCEFGMWTFSCFDGAVSNLYYPFSFLNSVSLLLLVWALERAYGPKPGSEEYGMDENYQTILKSSFFTIVLVCCFGGILLGTWMRDTLFAGMEELAFGSDVFNIIPIVLFIISLVMIAFAVAVILVVTFSEKVAENNKLREARQVAEHSNAAKSDFLANMSHEIRTPINAVLGMNEMVLRESMQARDRLPQDPEAVRAAFSDICTYAGDIQSAGSNLLSIINDILDFSKIEAGRLELVETDYKLSAVLNDVSNMIVFKARDKGLAFRVDVDGALPDGLRGDEVRVRQILTNILNNAVKYTRAGSVLLTVRGETEGERIRLTLRVKDTGIGIKPEDVGKLFQKFERVDLEQNSTVEGTGLGLAITRSLLDMMGGGIQVESRYGEGSVFTVTLPQKIVSMEPVGDFHEKFRQSIQETKAYRESFRAPDARILAVDDTQMNLTVVVNLLKKTGIGIDTAVSGADAVALAQSRRYDLVLMDQRMPGMDGTEAMHRIREQPDGMNRNVPFICLTADAVMGAKDRYMAEGFTDYLTKPIDSRALEQMLMRYLPAEKVIPVRGGTPDADEAAPEPGAADVFAPLRQAGIDPAIGMGYCQQDERLYASLLREYAQSAGQKRLDLERFYAAQDWKNYSILVHSIKSTSRMIGAASLSELAARLEAASDAASAGDVEAEHGALLEAYAAAAQAIPPVCGGGNESEPEDGEEVFEFLPDED